MVSYGLMEIKIDKGGMMVRAIVKCEFSAECGATQCVHALRHLKDDDCTLYCDTVGSIPRCIAVWEDSKCKE